MCRRAHGSERCSREGVQDGRSVGGAYGKATLSIEKGPNNTIVVKRTWVLDQHAISVKEYDAWRAFLLQVDALFRREVRFIKGAA